MLIEYNYIMPGGIDLKYLMDFMDWWESNFPKDYLTIHQNNEIKESNSSMDGLPVVWIQYPMKTKISLKFTNFQDINYFRLLHAKVFDQYLISETVTY